MKPLRTRDDILEFAAAHAPSKACATAIKERRVIVAARPDVIGWFVHVESVRGREWRLLVRCNEETRNYSLEWL